MNKIYNLKQDNLNTESSTDELDLLKTQNKKNRRKNEILNGFILLIGVVGFLTAFLLPRDFVYSRSSLETSFTNSSYSLASSSLPMEPVKQAAPAIDWDKHFKINGYKEVGEVLEFEFDHYSKECAVIYTIQFGNKSAKEMTGKITKYSYPSSGTYWVKVIANLDGEEKEIHRKKITIDEEIFVNSMAYREAK